MYMCRIYTSSAERGVAEKNIHLITCSGSTPRKCVMPLAWYGSPT